MELFSNLIRDVMDEDGGTLGDGDGEGGGVVYGLKASSRR